MSNDEVWDNAGAVPPPHWPECKYTPQVGDTIRHRDWSPGEHLVVTEVGLLGLKGDWSRTGQSTFFSRHPDGRTREWLNVTPGASGSPKETTP